MALIKAYEHKPQQITPMYKEGGFDEKTKKFKAFKEVPDVHEVLDAITAATEAGIIDSKKWVKQIFGTPENFNEFLENYEVYDECYKTYDRWYFALMKIVGTLCEEGFVSSQEIADSLREAAAETGQI